MSLSREALERALFQNGTGLESVPGLRPEQLIPAVIAYLKKWDMTQFFGRIQEAISNWERENGKRFPEDYAVVEIHPYALREYWKEWPPEQLFIHKTAALAGPHRVFGIEIIENQQLHRTFWKLVLGSRMLTNGEVLEVF